MATASVVLTDNLTCPICQDVLSEPKILQCSHTCCLECLSHLRESQGLDESIKCPVCRTESPVPNGDILSLPTNQIVKSLAEDHKKRSEQTATSTDGCGPGGGATNDDSYTSCTVCDEGSAAPAAVYCQKCTNFMCPSCLVPHSKLHKDSHKLDNIQDIQSGQVRIRHHCQEHSEDILDSICLTCRKCVCIRCRIAPSSHEGHNVVELADFEESLQADVDILQERVKAKTGEITQYVEYIDAKKSHIKKVLGQRKQQITKVHHNAVEELTNKRDALLKKCQDFEEKLVKELEDLSSHQTLTLDVILAHSLEIGHNVEASLLQQTLPDETLRNHIEAVMANVHHDRGIPEAIAKRASNLSFQSAQETGTVTSLELGAVKISDIL